MSAAFMEWPKFAEEYLDPPPTRRTGKRWIIDGALAGKIIGSGTTERIYVDLDRFLADRDSTRTMDETTHELLFGSKSAD